LGFIVAILIAARNGVRLLPPLAALSHHGGGMARRRRHVADAPADMYVSQRCWRSRWRSSSPLMLFSASGRDPGWLAPARHLPGRLQRVQYMGSLLSIAWINTTLPIASTALRRSRAASVLGDPQVAARVMQLGVGLACRRRFGFRAQQGISLLAQQVTRESFVLAYNDVFGTSSPSVASCSFGSRC